MNTNKFLIGGIAGGIASFLLGWLIYGVLMKDFYAGHVPAGGCKMGEMPIMWALVVGNFGFGFLTSYIFTKWANITSAAGGAQAGAMIGLLSGIGFDMIGYATMNSMDLTGAIVDIIVNVVLTALVGAAVGMALGMGNNK